MQIAIIDGQFLRRDLALIAGTDNTVELRCYPPAPLEDRQDPIDIEGELKMRVWRGGYSRLDLTGTGKNPVVFDLSAGSLQREIGRWYWRIQQTHNNKITALCGGVLDVRNADGCEP